MISTRSVRTQRTLGTGVAIHAAALLRCWVPASCPAAAVSVNIMRGSLRSKIRGSNAGCDLALTYP
eukprot:scaffold193431_cov30-Prasinocladus_malaysianus.AAC.1